MATWRRVSTVVIGWPRYRSARRRSRADGDPVAGGTLGAIEDPVSAPLAGRGLFADTAADAFTAWRSGLREVDLSSGEALTRHGARADSFALVLDGVLVATDEAGRVVGTIGPGDLVGELALLTRSVRSATVAAVTTARVAIGDGDQLVAMLALNGVARRLALIVAGRLAELCTPIDVTLRTGEVVALRPVVPGDRQLIGDALRRQSKEWFSRRFFQAQPPSQETIDFLVLVNHIDHFSWIAGAHGTDAATARYLRDADVANSAEVAFEVTEEWRGKGLGSVMFGALGVAAIAAGIERFVAVTQRDNEPMRRLLRRAGGSWAFAGADVLSGECSTRGAAELLPEGLRAQLAAIAGPIASGAGLNAHH